jgi:hypothetical protein
MFMRVNCITLLALALGVFVPAGEAASGRILKVLPHYLDREGRVALSPSLFERDAYQAQLRQHREQCSGLRFDVHWKARQAASAELMLRLELLTTKTTKDRPLVLEGPAKARTAWRRWTSLSLTGSAFHEAGDLIAWRVTLWHGHQLLAEQKSFLW